MPPILVLEIAEIATAAAVGFGAAELLNSSNPKQPGTPTTPSQNTAAQTATQAQTQQRQAALAAGGQTNVTGGSGIVLGSDVNSVTLVGAS